MTGNPRPRDLETRAVHHPRATGEEHALTTPLFQSTTFRLPDAESGAELSHAVAPTRFYTRWGNPTVRVCEEVIADLEGAESALACASGMGAISTLLLTLLEQGDHVVIGRSIYSGVSELANGVLRDFGVRTTSVDARDPDAIERALEPKTGLIFVESPSNPTLELCDLDALARLGSRRGVITAVDSTFATPVVQSPLSLGVDVVVHAATKALGGHSDVTAGVICGSSQLIERVWRTAKLLGPSLSPFEAWLLLRGLKTLAVRVREQCRSALRLARMLGTLPEVERVHYPGLESHPQHELARRQMRDFGGIVSFELAGGHEAAVRFVESLETVVLAVSLGGVESLIQHPASMTHGMLAEEEVRAAGISSGLLRLSVGLESVADLEADVRQALAAAAPPPGASR